MFFVLRVSNEKFSILGSLCGKNFFRKIIFSKNIPKVRAIHFVLKFFQNCFKIFFFAKVRNMEISNPGGDWENLFFENFSKVTPIHFILKFFQKFFQNFFIAKVRNMEISNPGGFREKNIFSK